MEIDPPNSSSPLPASLLTAMTVASSLAWAQEGRRELQALGKRLSPSIKRARW